MGRVKAKKRDRTEKERKPMRGSRAIFHPEARQEAE